jgi:cysteinyl-tRNA synthetase
MAFSEMFQYAKFCKKLSKKESLIDDSRDVLRGMGSVLGLLGDSIKEKKEVRLPVSLSENEISRLVKQRTNAKREKNYELADKIREDLADKGILLEDGPGDTSWKFIRGNVKK